MYRFSQAKGLSQAVVSAAYNALLPDTCVLCEQILKHHQITYALIAVWLCPITSFPASLVLCRCNQQQRVIAALV